MLGMGWRIDPIEGHVLDDIQRLYYLRKLLKRPCGLLLPTSFTSALQFFLAGIPSVGYAADARSLLLKHRIKHPDGKLHTVEDFFCLSLEAVRYWGAEPAYTEVPKSLGLKLAKRHISGAKNLKKSLHIPDNYAIIAPIARGLRNGQLRHWLYMNEIVPVIRAMGVEPLVFPAEDDVEAAKAACPDATHMPPTNLGTFAALLKGARLVVSNDSGASHVAAAVGARQLTIFGVTDIWRSRPWNPNAEIIGSENGWPDVNSVKAKIREMLSSS